MLKVSGYMRSLYLNLSFMVECEYHMQWNPIVTTDIHKCSCLLLVEIENLLAMFSSSSSISSIFPLGKLLKV